MERKMKVFLATVAAGIMLAIPASAQMGNITGSEYAGEPLNSSVHSPARNPVTGLTPGGERAHGQVIVKRKHARSGHYVYSSRRGRYVFVPD
jgi:hypothetical protein